MNYGTILTPGIGDIPYDYAAFGVIETPGFSYITPSIGDIPFDYVRFGDVPTPGFGDIPGDISTGGGKVPAALMSVDSVNTSCCK